MISIASMKDLCPVKTRYFQKVNSSWAEKSYFSDLFLYGVFNLRRRKKNVIHWYMWRYMVFTGQQHIVPLLNFNKRNSKFPQLSTMCVFRYLYSLTTRQWMLCSQKGCQRQSTYMCVNMWQSQKARKILCVLLSHWFRWTGQCSPCNSDHTTVARLASHCHCTHFNFINVRLATVVHSFASHGTAYKMWINVSWSKV